MDEIVFPTRKGTRMSMFECFHVGIGVTHHCNEKVEKERDEEKVDDETVETVAMRHFQIATIKNCLIHSSLYVSTLAYVSPIIAMRRLRRNEMREK